MTALSAKEIKEIGREINMRLKSIEEVLKESGKKEEEHIPLGEKYLLSVREASLYTGIGSTKMNELLRVPRCPFVVYNGTKKLVKRIELEKYIEKNRVI